MKPFRQSWFAAALMALAGIMAFTLFAMSRAEVLPVAPFTFSREYFGMHIHHADTTTRWPAVNFGSWRLWDAAVSWERLEPEPGQWDFSRLDRLVSLAEAHHVELVLTLGNTPVWASARPDEPCPYGMGCAAEPWNLADWAHYVHAVASRYKGRIHYYEVWNEPKFSDYEADAKNGFFSGSLEKMLELVRTARWILKAVDPQNKILTPGFNGDGQRLDVFLQRGGKDLVDIVSFHFYSPTPEIMYRRIGDVRKIMDRDGAGQMPLWDTEQGYEPLPAGASAPGPDSSAVSGEDTLAAYVPRSLILAAAAGVKRFFWYSWEWTLLTKAGVPSPAGIAYGQTVRWLNGATLQGCTTESDGVWFCGLTRGARRAWVVWSPKGPLSWSPPEGWGGVEYESIDGALHPIAEPGALAIGPAPILVKNDSLLWASGG